jgi:ComF family protein
MRGLWAAGLDFVYPPHCLLCTRETPPSEGTATASFCDPCRDALTANAAVASCPKCGAPAGPYLDTSQGCVYCRRDHFAFDGVIRLGTYETQLRTACLRGKHRGAEGLLTALADLVWRHAQDQFQAAQFDLVVPVPQHWTQRFTRPHNPAETLARIWSRRLSAEYGSRLVVKTRRTQRQLRLPPQERRVNVRNAFAVTAPEEVAGRTILVADDVLTTGATAHEVARALRQARAARIIIAVVARGLGQR